MLPIKNISIALALFASSNALWSQTQAPNFDKLLRGGKDLKAQIENPPLTRNARDDRDLSAQGQTGTIAKESPPLTCNSGANEVWAVYEQRANEKTRSLNSNLAKDSMKKRLQDMDEEILSGVWFATDYNSLKNSEFSNLELAILRADGLKVIDTVRQTIIKRCSSKDTDPCADINPGPAECVAFFNARYEFIFQKLNKAKMDVQSSPLTNHVNQIASKSMNDFGIKNSDLVISGDYVVLDHQRFSNKVKDYPLEQSNLRAIDKYQQVNQVVTPPTRGEFEKLEDFNARIAKIRSKSSLSSENVDFRSILEQELNRKQKLSIDVASVKYDPDAMQFAITVVDEGSNLRVPMAIKAPIEEAPKVKSYLLNTNNPKANLDQKYKPWLVFALDGKTLTLRGGYIMLYAAENKQMYKMQSTSVSPLSVSVGSEAADRFRPIFSAKLQDKLTKEQIDASIRRQQWCDNFRLVIAEKNPQYYSSIVAASGCQ